MANETKPECANCGQPAQGPAAYRDDYNGLWYCSGECLIAYSRREMQMLREMSKCEEAQTDER